MSAGVTVGGLVAVVLLTPRLVTPQTPSYQNIYVLKATSPQATTTEPLVLTFNEPYMQGKKRMVRQAVITVAATDVIESLTSQVRTHARSDFAYEPSAGLLFVLDVRTRNIPATTSDPLVLTLSSGTVVTIPSSGVHDAATLWLRSNLRGMSTGQASASAPAVDIFDTEGVDFGPWLRKFKAQVSRYWFVPEEALKQLGHVRAKFNVHKDGRITDVVVVEASSVESFNKSVLTALRESNPTYPLPTEYRSPHATFILTFYFNETPR